MDAEPKQVQVSLESNSFVTQNQETEFEWDFLHPELRGGYGNARSVLARNPLQAMLVRCKS